MNTPAATPVANGAAPHELTKEEIIRIASQPDTAPATPMTGTEWSIMNHRASGLFVLVWGLTALLVGLQWPRKTWLRFVPPFAFFGLAEFLILRSDPKSWPTGPIPFWVSLQDPAALQHRVFILLIIAIGVVELLRAADKLPPLLYKFALPALATFGGIFLFFHHHGTIVAQPMMPMNAASMATVKAEHVWFSACGFGLAAAKLLADGGILKGRLGATLWTLFAIALGIYMMGYTE